jgi:hypothetical protein
MEKSKVKEVCLSVLKWALIIAVLAGFSYLSVWAGVSAIVFGLNGFLYGYCRKLDKHAKETFDAIEKYAKDVVDGKVLTVTEDENGVTSVYVTEPKKKVSKK